MGKGRANTRTHALQCYVELECVVSAYLSGDVMGSRTTTWWILLPGTATLFLELHYFCFLLEWHVLRKCLCISACPHAYVFMCVCIYVKDAKEASLSFSQCSNRKLHDIEQVHNQ